MSRGRMDWRSLRRRTPGITFVANPSKGAPPGHLLAQCWCEGHMAHIPAEWVARGETFSCGAPDCHPRT